MTFEDIDLAMRTVKKPKATKEERRHAGMVFCDMKGNELFAMIEKSSEATRRKLDELMDYYAIGQCTPGVIAVNTSTFIGYKTHGILGGIAATAGMITPSLIIITIIAAFIQQFAHLAVVQHAFAGIRIAVCALVLQSVWKMAKKGVVDVPTSVILLVTFAAVAFFGVSPVVMVVIAAAAGIIIGMIRRTRA